ncbi:MAG: DnaJ domain-containing protein [Magnetospirillum sp.]
MGATSKTKVMNSTLSQDPKGYYAILGLAPGADMEAIRTAYRSRIKKVHPDRNPTESAKLEFQRLVEAYKVLQDVLRRAEYDATGVHPLTEDGEDYPSSPFACSRCGKVTAQPRYVIFHQVKSYLVWSRWIRDEGIFCRDCADIAAARASTQTWAWGWWSPMGLLLTPIALLRNLFGGTKPRHQNARLLIRQARAFLDLEETDLARGLTDQAARFARLSVHKRQVQVLRQATQDSTRKLRGRWAPWKGGVFAAQGLPLLALPAALGLLGFGLTKPWEQPVATSAGIAVQPALVGDIRHVAIPDLKLRQAPLDGAPVLTLLDRFTTVQILDSPDPEWAQVRTPSGIIGWVSRRGLYAGTGARHKQDWCEANKGARPEPGEVLMRRASGEHRLMIHNEGRFDAVVKLKTTSGTTVVSYFIPATYHLAVGNIPEGTYRMEFATGTSYSRGCGLFVANMEAGLLPFTVTFRTLAATRSASLLTLPEITVSPPAQDANGPQALDLEKFGEDD